MRKKLARTLRLVAQRLDPPPRGLPSGETYAALVGQLFPRTPEGCARAAERFSRAYFKEKL